jgi:GNAT superfamily N-acetyltransferase
MRRAFRQADFDALATLWGEFYPPRYRVGADTIRQHTTQCLAFDWGASAVEVEEGFTLGFVAIKRSANPALFRGPDPDQAHLSALAFKDPSVAVDLCAFAKSVLRNRGVYRVIFGQDASHFFPGCPEDCPTLRSFLTVEGFQEGDTFCDFERDLAGYEAPSGALDPLGKWPGRKSSDDSKPSVVPIPLDDVPRLATFLKAEFPGRWHHDVLEMIRAEDRSDFVYVLYINGRIEGFAVTQDSRQKAPVGGAVWREDLGEGWAALGPIGVSKEARGKGLGSALLAATLTALSQGGARKTIIDWTVLTDFYAKHGFEVSRKYRSYELRLD